MRDFVGVAGNRRDAGSAQDGHALGAMAFGHHRSDLLGHAAHQDAWLRLDDGDFGAASDRARRELQPDEAAADDGDALAWLEMPADGERIVKAAQGEAARSCACRQGSCRGRAPVAKSSLS